MNYKIYITAIAVVIMLCALSEAKASDTTDIRIGKNLFYIQLSGKANNYSLNYERIFKRGKNIHYSYSAGMSFFNKNISVPFSLNAITAGPRHHFELSLGIIPYIEKKLIDPVKGKTETDKQVYIKPTIGYRFQKPGDGFFFKAGLGPQIFMDPPSYNIWKFTPQFIAPSAHIAAGFSF